MQSFFARLWILTGWNNEYGTIYHLLTIKKANPPDWLIYILLRSFQLVSTAMLQLSYPEYIQHVPIAVKK